MDFDKFMKQIKKIPTDRSDLQEKPHFRRKEHHRLSSGQIMHQQWSYCRSVHVDLSRFPF